MTTNQLWNKYNGEAYFFILKKVKNKEGANDILQNSFFKIHQKLHQVRDDEKIKAWVFQIIRNEIANFFNRESKYVEDFSSLTAENPNDYERFCCFERFINELPQNYQEVIELVYIQGEKQQEAAVKLDISLANVKARIRRAKAILKQNFKDCCKFELNPDGELMGTANCAYCETEKTVHQSSEDS